MPSKNALVLGTSLIALCAFCIVGHVSAEPQPAPIVRLAELVIDPAQLEEYKTALREEIETSIRMEPGVLSLFAVSVKDHPEQIRLFETYRDMAAYQAHLQTAHFKKYKAVTKNMVRSLTLTETEPILLGSKAKGI